MLTPNRRARLFEGRPTVLADVAQDLLDRFVPARGGGQLDHALGQRLGVATELLELLPHLDLRLRGFSAVLILPMYAWSV